MTTGRRRAAIAGWGLATAALWACAAVAVVLGLRWPEQDFPSAVLTQDPVWSITMTPSLLVASGASAWCGIRGHRTVAAWSYAACMSVVAYWLAPALGGALSAGGATGTWLFSGLLVVGTAGWTTALAMLQLASLAAARDALGRGFARWAWVFVIGAAALMLLSAAVFPFTEASAAYPDAPTLLPVAVADAPAAQIASTVLAYVWMASLFVAPVALWVGALRARGSERRAVARIAVGAMLPALVVMLCGLLAAMTRLGVGNEVAGLALGFSLALPATLVWLAATVRDSRSASARLTSVGNVVRALLWALYVVGIMQVAIPLAGPFGSGAGAGAAVATALLAITFWPWRSLVAWCARIVDPRAAVAAAVVGADRSGASAPLAQRALRQALGDPNARLSIAVEPDEPGGVPTWQDAEGRPAPDPLDAREGSTIGDDAVVVLTAAHGRMLAALTSQVRFVDARPLLAAVRPLVERAGLEAQVRARSERVAAERRRADRAAEEARHRIERDLHDGVQGRLVGLGLDLRMARDALTDPIGRDALDHAVAELRGTVAELRELSAGTLGARLGEHGLAAAVGDLAGRVPVPIEVDIPALSLPSVVQSTAYFVIAESITNAVKHSGAGRIGVRVVAGDAVTVLIDDDGCGGADPRAGTGLRGLRERIHALGGHLIVSERMPRGTLVEAVLPCGW